VGLPLPISAEALARVDQGVTLEALSDSGPVASSPEAGLGTRSLDRLEPEKWSLATDVPDTLWLSVELDN
jgi:hypothetical protein